MASNVFLVRNGETIWCEQGRLLGRRDIGLTEKGSAQAHQAAEALGDLEISEVIASPLRRAVQTAEAFASKAGIDVARDPRLTNIDTGKWEGTSLEELWKTEDFRRFVAREEESFPHGEALQTVRQRVVASVEQALTDNPEAAQIVMVSHSAPIRIVLAHYLGMPVGLFHRIRLSHCGMCILRFEDDIKRTRVLAANWAGPLEAVLARLRRAP